MKKALFIVSIFATLAIAENTVHYDMDNRSDVSSDSDKVHYDQHVEAPKPLSEPNHPSTELYGK